MDFLKEWGLPILAILSVLYLFFTLSTKTNNKKGGVTNSSSFDFSSLNLSSNLESLLYIAILAALVFWFIPIAYPEFWSRYSASGIFLPSIIISIFCLYMWSKKYFLFMFVFFFIIFMILYRFSDTKEKKEIEEIEENGVNFTIENLDNGQVYYAKTSFNKPFEDQINFQYRITAEYGKGIILSAKNWSSPDTLIGGVKTDGTSEPHQGPIKIIPLR